MLSIDLTEPRCTIRRRLLSTASLWPCPALFNVACFSTTLYTVSKDAYPYFWTGCTCFLPSFGNITIYLSRRNALQNSNYLTKPDSRITRCLCQHCRYNHGSLPKHCLLAKWSRSHLNLSSLFVLIRCCIECLDGMTLCLCLFLDFIHRNIL